MKKTLLPFLAVAVLLGAARWCPAAESEMKPLATVSFAGYDKLMANIGVVGRLGGNPDLDKGLDMILKMMTGGKGLDGLDAKRPWGAAMLTDGQETVKFGFVPVTDLKKLIEVAKANPNLAQLLKPGENGVYEIQTGGPAVYIQQKGKWAIVAAKSEDLANAPADPEKLLGDLPKNYDLAVRVSVKNCPKEWREQVLAQIQAGAEAGMTQMPGESDDQYELRVNAAKQAVEKITTLLNELEDVTLGWNVDVSTNRTYLDFDLTAQTGTKLAAQLATMKPGKTNFAGALLPEAAVTANWASTLSDADVAEAKTSLETGKKSIVAELEKQGLSEGEVKLASQLIGDVVDVLQKTLEAKKSDGGLAVILEPAAVTLVGGCAIVEGAKLDKVLKQLVDELEKSDPDSAKKIKLNAETYKGVRFHKLSVPTPNPKLEPMIGDTADVIVGVADDKLMVAAGRDAAKTLKKVIDGSKAAADREVPPFELKLSAAKIAKFVAEVAEDDDVKTKAAMLAGTFEKAAAKDHVIVTAKAIPQGVRVRLELEEGLLKALASMAGQMSPMGGMPGGPMPGGDK